jgi:hypothetical protein
MEEELTTTKYVLTDRDKSVRKEMLDLMNKPKFVQTYMFHKDKVTKVYNATVIVDKPDRISIINKSFALRIGNNGVFIKQGKYKTGVTYHKKGRSSARLRYWNTGPEHKGEQYSIVKAIAEEINPDCLHIFNSDVIKQIGTQGMFGSIIAGKTDTIAKAMEYYIRYSLRGVGVNMTPAENLYNFIHCMRYGTYTGLKALRVAKDPNAVLELCADISDPLLAIKKVPRIAIITEESSAITDLALMVGEKIDWTAPTFNADEIQKKLEEKVETVGRQIDMWDHGPVLKINKSPQATNEMVSASIGTGDLPF